MSSSAQGRRRRQAVYASGASIYERLVAAEDVDGELEELLQRKTCGRRQRVLDIGTGNGRMLRLVEDTAGVLVAVDLSLHMLTSVQLHGQRPYFPAAASAHQLPFRSGLFDLVMAGWVFGHAASLGSAWEAVAASYVEEMGRVGRRGALLVVVESLGTGVDEPRPPTTALATYYEWLERSMGFARTAVLATDYCFDSVAEAKALIAAFYGDALGERVAARGSPRVPEYTGVWMREVEGHHCGSRAR